MTVISCFIAIGSSGYGFYNATKSYGSLNTIYAGLSFSNEFRYNLVLTPYYNIITHSDPS